MAEHTPGPWRVDNESIVTDSLCIAVIEASGGYQAPTAQRDANARLIAAAPSLLLACQAYVDLFRSSDMRPEDECHEVFGIALDAVDMAVGKETSAVSLPKAVAAEALMRLTPDQRLDLITEFCPGCGETQTHPACQCQNDE